MRRGNTYFLPSPEPGKEVFFNALMTSNLLRRLLVQEVVAKMDGWTREVWGYLRGGSSWAWIADRFGMSKEQAKMRYRYYLYKIRLSLAPDEKDDQEQFKSEQSAA
jgi:hypothetical protein